MSVNLTPFLTATKKNTEKCSYFHLLDFKLLYSLRPSIHKFHETEEHFYYALETYYKYFILFYLAQNFCPHASIMLQVHYELFLTLSFSKYPYPGSSIPLYLPALQEI